MPLDETIVVAMCVGVLIAFVAAVVNKLTGWGLLSRMAERVTFVLIPPLLLIFLGARYYLPSASPHRPKGARWAPSAPW